jgi:SulP family sulfate permease
VGFFVAEAITYIDSTAIDMLRALQAELSEQGIVLAVARAKRMLVDIFDSTGLTEAIGREHLYPSVRAGVAAYESRVGRSG